MSEQANYIRWFNELTIEDVPLVGGKNASLGEMYRELTPQGIQIPNGFAVTAEAYRYVLDQAQGWDALHQALDGLNPDDVTDLANRARKAREIIYAAPFPKDLEQQIIAAFNQLKQQYGDDLSVAVRSSATAEDLPTASFAGQQDTYLNIRGDQALLESCKRCFASLFTDRAIHYRIDQGFDHFKLALSIGIMKMVRSDLDASGVMFSLDTESGFTDVVFITGAYGLGENVVQGAVDPDEFYVHKPTFEQGHRAVLRRTLGAKKIKMVYSDGRTREPTHNIVTSAEERNRYCLNDADVLTLADYAIKIEKHYSAKAGQARPMDIEWAKDGIDGTLYIVQARPETVVSQLRGMVLEQYSLKQSAAPIVIGHAVGSKIASGNARIIDKLEQLSSFKAGDILVADMTTPDWEPVMKIASAIVTNRGGRTCFSGDTILLTNQGFLTFAELEQRGCEDIQVPSLNRDTLKIEWKNVEAVMKKTARLLQVNVSQTGRMKNNTLKVTADHKMLNLRDGQLVDTELQEMLSNQECALLAQYIPALTSSTNKQKKLAYLLGGIMTDGHIHRSRTHGEVVFIQKPTAVKQQFIAAMNDALHSVYGKLFKAFEKKQSQGFIRGQQVVGEATAYRCFSKDVAYQLHDEATTISQTLLKGDTDLVCSFLAGVIDGDGSFNNGRVNIYVSKQELLEAVIVACLRIGTVPSVTVNRTIYNVQIVEKLDLLNQYTQRVRCQDARVRTGTRFFNTRQLFTTPFNSDINNRSAKNYLIDEQQLRATLEQVTDSTLKNNLEKLLASDLRQLRLQTVHELEEQAVYNITVADHHNYIVFSERYTPVLVNNCHAAIISRELGVPAVVGCDNATTLIQHDSLVTVSCAEGDVGKVYADLLDFDIQSTDLSGLQQPKTHIMLNIGNPELAFKTSFLPNAGVGLARMEFIITEYIKAHPMALIHPEKVQDAAERGQLNQLTRHYASPEDYFIEKLSEGVGTIAAAFYPKPVVVRMSDFKTNEYATLLGGSWFEFDEENPMIGFRGASRYIHPAYAEGFALECRAMKRVRDEMGLTNVILMIPFCRRVQEAKKVLDYMAELGLKRGDNGLQIYVMCEIPNNVIQIDAFSQHFDGFSIGSNDLTQLTLGVDRDSAILAEDFDERDPGVKEMIRLAVEGARRNGKHCGLCGQAPSDYPEMAEFLVEIGIDSMSLNPDSVLKTTQLVLATERRLGK
ncbi:MAG: PEP/pyruvate-binding domain-containing protein [Methylobacter sp.]|nr:PEP/pyruvate-binding domain-containing protein [Methylobacter sp.]MDP2099504.1 PEP/pyruvate-binding domain-containing protein [Methylobacter sp.]MDP2429744.1 PEP/pyruvate-binding domain-containing protein [Methylobacter sp.]MDP3055612.1 PEP/pyruvate-binding domain-containing protein [Methylobacter sp.]MDP3361018.1 PEP/pyruvate-binding domain-containing protein [Methylobacter sp.]